MYSYDDCIDNKVSIRPFKDSDYDSVKEILEEAGLFSESLDSKPNMLKKIKVFPGSIIVAIVVNRVVGCVFALEEVHGISHLAVDKKFRKKGLGSILLRAAEKHLISKGINKWTLFTFRNRPDLHGYYKNRGYEKGGDIIIFTKREEKPAG